MRQRAAAVRDRRQLAGQVHAAVPVTGEGSRTHLHITNGRNGQPAGDVHRDGESFWPGWAQRAAAAGDSAAAADRVLQAPGGDK